MALNKRTDEVDNGTNLNKQIIRWLGISAFLGIAAGVAMGIIFKDPERAILAGLAGFIVTSIIDFRLNFEKSVIETLNHFNKIVTDEKSEIIRLFAQEKFNFEKGMRLEKTELKKNYESLATLLELKDHFSELWISQILNNIISFKRTLKGYEKRLFEDEINQTISQVKEKFSVTRDFDDAKTEIIRKNMLRTAIETAEDYILAVSYDVNDYIETFFDQRTDFLGSYMDANIKAAERGVRVKRIFVLEDEIYDRLTSISDAEYNNLLLLDDKDIMKPPPLEKNTPDYKVEIMKRILVLHLRGYDKLIAQICPMSKATQVPPKSFLVCDDYICSEAKRDSETNQLTGKVVLRDNQMVNNFKNIFNYLETASYSVIPPSRRRKQHKT